MRRSEYIWIVFGCFDANQVSESDQISEKTPIPPPDWEALIEVIAKDMIEERSPARILQVRAKLYDLLTHCIPATTILKVRWPAQQT